MNHENEIVNVRIDEIIPNRFQPRLAFDEQALKDLADSIKMHGIIQPLVLRRVGDKYEIIAGERRYKASVLVGLQTVPAVILNLDDQKSAEVAVVENLQRKDLSAIEEAQSFKKILDMGYLTQEELAVRMGVSQSTVANKLRLLNLTIPVKEALLHNKISERHARSLLSIMDNNEQIAMLDRIISERLTVRQTDEEINKLLGKTKVEEIAPVENNSVFSEIEKQKMEAIDIIPEYKPKDLDFLLRPNDETPVIEIVEEKETASPVNFAINPFQEEPEIMDFEIFNQSFENPINDQSYTNSENSIIEEFRNTQSVDEPVTIDEPSSNNISKAITRAREEVRKIEDMGFEVETEEFDFEDMYQIIVKIKKD